MQEISAHSGREWFSFPDGNCILRKPIRDLTGFMVYPSIFAFGLVAFGFLGMGPVTIAVDSYGPVTDNAQSIYELSLIEENTNAIC